MNLCQKTISPNAQRCSLDRSGVDSQEHIKREDTVNAAVA